MDRPSAILICVAFFVLHTKCIFADDHYDSIEEECKREGSFNEECVPGNTGYRTCKKDNILVQNFIETITCTKPASTCRCFSGFELKQICECVNPTEPPKFPPVGILRWSGTVYLLRYKDGYQVTGEVHKNSNGNFLQKKINHWPYWIPTEKKEEFEIIVRNGTTFTKYTGDVNSKVCRKHEVNSEGNLSSIWEKHSNVGYKLDSEESWGSKRTQVWKQFEQDEDRLPGEEYHASWRWTIEYDAEKGYAIPLSYYHNVYDGFDETGYTINYDYTFIPVGNDEETFRLDDYCCY